MIKNANRFSKWQEANQTRREKIIEQYLVYLGKTRVVVRNVTDLADLIARHIAQVEGRPCNKATLLRNLRYKSRLLSFQARSSVSAKPGADGHTVSDAIGRVAVLKSQLEAANLRRELERLKIYSKTLEEQLDRLHYAGNVLENDVISLRENSPTNVEARSEVMFIRTCQALRAILSHFSTIVEVNPASHCILDRSRRRNNVIVDEEIAGPFFEWLNRCQGMQSEQLRNR